MVKNNGAGVRQKLNIHWTLKILNDKSIVRIN